MGAASALRSPRPAFDADLSFLGNRLPDREARVEQFFLHAAGLLPERRFLLGDAVNMSFNIGFLSGGPCDADNPALTAALARVRARGTVLVASSGNDAWAKGMRPPACISGVLSVGAIYHTNLPSASLLGCTDTPAQVDRVTCFSSSSYLLDLLAPGYRVPTAYNLVGVGSASGTSFSAPHVAGAVALLRQIDPQMTPDAIEQVLESTGRPIVDSRNGITTPRLDLFAAVMKVRNWPVVRRRAVRK